MDKPLNPFSFMPLIELSFYKRIFFYLILPFTYAIDLKIAYLLLLPICILIILMLVRNSYAFLILVSSTFGISYLYYLGYTHSGVHVGILFLAIFYTIWLSYLKSDQIINSENKIRINQYWFKEKIRSFDTLTYRQVVLIFSIITLPYLNYWAVKKAIRELKLPFSNSQNAAKYLIENGYDNTKYEIVTYPADQTLPILPFLRQRDSFNYYGYRKGNYIEWDEELGQHYYHYVHDMNQYFENIRQISKRDSSSIFILSLARNRPKVIIPEDFEVLAKFEGAVIEGENYAIFKLK
ncbi:MAG: hypothetical protein R2728_14910 [Chitinophagales bacterium]